MIKRTLRTVAESAGILTPTLADVTAAAEQRRQELTAAQRAVDAAVANLEAGHDASAADGELLKLEATVADARVTLERAQRSYHSAERRLQAATDAEQSKAKAAARVKLDAALATRKSVALKIDAAARELAAAVAVFNRTADAIAEARRAGVAGQYTFGVTAQRMIEHALERAGALPSHWFGDPVLQPTATELAASDEATLRAGA